MANGRCRMHGGLSTGPKTATGLEASRTAGWRHGRRSREAIALKRLTRAQIETLTEMGEALDRAGDPFLPEKLRQLAWSEYWEKRELPEQLRAEADRCRDVLTRRGYEPKPRN